MCVIFINEFIRPSEKQVEQAYEQNDAGAGIAWRDGGAVHYEKGLDLEGIKRLCAAVPLPFVAHFRIPSGTFPKRDDLCHPFPIEKTAPLALKGITKGGVLFHNGHWGKWQDLMLEATVRSGIKVPTGKWSDSRAMAFLTSIYGIGFLELLNDQRTAVLTPGNIDVTGMWSRVSMPDNNFFWASNRQWDTVKAAYHATGASSLCTVKGCNRYKYALTPYCWEHKTKFEEDDKKKLEDVVTVALDAVLSETEDKTKGSGGTPKVLPFVQVSKLFHEGKLSKNKWKKARRAYENMQEKLSRQRLREAEQQLKDDERVTLH